MKRSMEINGAEVQYFRLEPRYWKPVLQRLKDTGLRTATTYVPWGTHAVAPPDPRHPAGRFDFTGRTSPQRNLVRYLDLVGELGLSLNFRSGPFCCNEMPHGGYPEWLVLGDPNMMVWDWQNRTTQGYWIGRREGSQPSYLHPDYLRMSRAWLDAVAGFIRPRLKSKGGCIHMINLDNEVSYIVKDSFLDSDYNPVNVAPGGFYHQFLREKYAAAHRLPYGRGFRDFEAVRPPRSVPETLGDDFAWYADWVEFKTWVMARYLRTLREMHEENGIRDVLFMTNFNPHLPEGVPTRMPAFEDACGPNGMAGYDFYRGAFMSYSGYQSMARVLKLMNASLKYTWSAEFMSGTWNRVLPGRVSDDHMRFMARCALAQGCKAIDWFMFHDRDCWGDSPVSEHGHPRPSFDVLRDTADLLSRRIRNWDALAPQTDVAVIYDLAQHVQTAIGDPSPCSDNNHHVGKPAVDGIPAGRASLEYYGLFRLIEHCGMQPGAVDPAAQPGRLAGYPLAFLPGSPVLTRTTAALVDGFVRRGGRLVISGPWPKREETGARLRLFGRAPPRKAATLRIGNGQVVWHPDFQAQAEPEKDCARAVARVEGWIAGAGIVPHVRIAPSGPVSWVDWVPAGGGACIEQPLNLGSAILHRGEGERLLFVLNHYPCAVRFSLTLREGGGALIDLDSGTRIPLRRKRAEVDMDRKSAAVYRIEGARPGHGAKGPS